MEQQAAPTLTVEVYGQKAERGPRDPKTGVRDPLPPLPLGLKGPSVAKHTTEEFLALILEWGKQWEQDDEVISKGEHKQNDRRNTGIGRQDQDAWAKQRER
ncbi:hypothetical protein MMC28_008476 [Mycoblastus sanguinarius]|nr:hypothetical protein [Mycoblastus sanguinarius]